jgi:hypothetical protein
MMVNIPQLEHTMTLCTDAKIAFAVLRNVWWELAENYTQMNRVAPLSEAHIALRGKCHELQIEWNDALGEYMDTQARFSAVVRR